MGYNDNADDGETKAELNRFSGLTSEYGDEDYVVQLAF